jgi:superfamily II DNA or RNA helicase
MTVRVVIVPTGGGQTVTGARATVKLDDRTVPTVDDDDPPA